MHHDVWGWVEIKGRYTSTASEAWGLPISYADQYEMWVQYLPNNERCIKPYKQTNVRG